jgi:transposase-like protein
MERSHVPLHKWLLAFHLMAASKKGMSAAQMGRMLGVTYKTAWFLCHRIREAMEGANPTGPLGGPGRVVEADETFVGGKARNRAYGKIPKKQMVVALVERGGNVASYHVASINAKTLRSIIVQKVERSSTLMTDQNASYVAVGREFTGGHFSVENFFSIFKRGIIGTYHHMSEAHLGRYCAEFDLRANTRDMSDAERADEILKGGIGRRLTYRRTDKLAA